MRIIIDDLSGQAIADFLEAHIRDMRAVSPPESKHALDLEGLRQPDITFWSLYQEDRLVACAALKELDPRHGELKSMRVASEARGRGVASGLLEHILHTARARGYERVSLETGAMAFFRPAVALYRKYGFLPCPPFGEYREDPNSLFMSLVL